MSLFPHRQTDTQTDRQTDGQTDRHTRAHLQQLFFVVRELLVRALSVFSQARVVQPAAFLLEGLNRRYLFIVKCMHAHTRAHKRSKASEIWLQGSTHLQKNRQISNIDQQQRE